MLVLRAGSVIGDQLYELWLLVPAAERLDKSRLAFVGYPFIMLRVDRLKWYLTPMIESLERVQLCNLLRITMIEHRPMLLVYPRTTSRFNGCAAKRVWLTQPSDRRHAAAGHSTNAQSLQIERIKFGQCGDDLIDLVRHLEDHIQCRFGFLLLIVVALTVAR